MALESYNYPEEAGIPSLHLVQMLRRWEKELCHVDGFMILKDGKVAAEAYRFPYNRASRRVLHSVSKTVTAIGVGIAVGEGLLSVDDPVLSFFPSYTPSGEAPEALKRLTVRHLLTMSTGHDGDRIDAIYSAGKDAWKAFLELPMKTEPGEVFVYNSGATYLLSKILTQLTGRTLLAYLEPRLFAPLGIRDADWDEVDGISTGGWGIKLSLPAMAKIGQLLLQGGVWEGSQLVPADWVEQMSSKQIATDSQVYEDWRQGYGYQMWRCCREGCFRADGAFGQYILVMPPKGMVAAIWSEDAFSQDMLDIFFEEIYDRVDDRVYGVDGRAFETWKREARTWTEVPSVPASASYLEPRIDGVRYLYSETDGESQPVGQIAFSFLDDGALEAVFQGPDGRSVIRAGAASPLIGRTEQTFEIASFIRFGAYRRERAPYAASYRWLSERMLEIHVNWLETAHSTDISVLFGDAALTVKFTPSYEKLLAGSQPNPALTVESRELVFTTTSPRGCTPIL